MNSHEPTGRRAEWGLVLIFAILSLGIVAGGAFYYRHYERQFRAAAGRELAAIAELKVGELAQYRKERLEDAAIFFNNAAFSDLVRRFFEHPEDIEAQRQIQEWAVKLMATGQYDLVRLLDAQGVSRLSSPAGAPPVSSVVMQRIPEILRSGHVTFQDFHRNEHDQRVYLDILIPILDGQNARRPLGVFYLRINPDKYLYPFIQRWPVPSETAETLLVRQDGNDALFLNELKFQTNTALNLRVSLEKTNLAAVKAVLGQQGIVECMDYRGETVLAALQAVPDSPWFLVARMDTAEVFAPMRARLWQVVVMICVLLLGSAAGVGLVWRQQQARFYRAQYESAEALRERVKELNCLYAIAGLIEKDNSIEKILQGSADVLPKGWFYPEIACARITFKGRQYQTGNFRATDWRLSADLKVDGQPAGMIELCYLQERPTRDEGPFIKEERNLINAIAERLGRVAERKQSAEKLLRDEAHFHSLANVLQHPATSVKEFLDFALDEAIKLTGSKIGYIYFYHADRKQFVLNTWSRDVMKECKVRDPQTCYELDKTGLWGEAVRQRRPIVLNDFQAAHPLKKGYPEGHARLDKYMTIPIFRGSEIVAVVAVANKAVDYNETDVTQLRLLMNTVWRVLERKQAEEKLARLQQHNELILSSAAEGILGLDLQGNHTFVNPAAARMLGYKAEDLLGRPSHSLWHHTKPGGNPYPREECLIYAAYQDGAEHRASNEVFWRKDGTSFPVEYASTPIHEQGRLAGAVVTFTDITERKQTEEKLRQLSRAVEQSPASIVITNPAGDIEYVNPKFVNVTGYTLAEALGKNSRILKSGNKGPEAYRELWKTITAGKEWNGEFLNKKKNGEVYWESASISPIRDLAGRITHYIAVKEDITARKQTETVRDQLIQDLKDALANVKSLSGLLPICAGCKKIRDDKGYWSQVESYIQKHSDATFTHGLCPDCVKKYMSDLDKDSPDKS